MDATRWMPRAGAAVLGLLLVALAVPAGASAAPSELSWDPDLPDRKTITFTDPSGNQDRVRVEVDHNTAESRDWFGFHNDGGAPFVHDGSGCTGSDLVMCPPDADVLVVLLAGGDDRVDVTSSKLTGDFTIESDVQGGAGNDTLVGLNAEDRFAGGAGTDTLDLRAGGPWVVSLDGIANDGPGAANVQPDVEVLLGGPENDQLTGGPGGNTIGGAGGNDTIHARDGAIDTITCGAGSDSGTADWNDNVAADCEGVVKSLRDDDGDGSPNGVDCNDGNAAIKPGAGDVPGNGVDDDCDGSDAVLDRDGDGAAAGADCDDADPNRRPGARDIPANRIDEDCSGADARRAVLDPKISSGWSVFPRWTVITKLTVADLPRGAKLSVRCTGKGCPFKRKAVKLRRGGAKLTRFFKGKRLRPGAVIELRVTAQNTIGAVRRIVIRKRKEPKRRELCLPPGAAKPTRC